MGSRMRHVKLTIAVASLFALTACPEAAGGERLCAAASIEALCGIAPDACLEALNEDDTFRIDHVFTAWSVSLDGDGTGTGAQRCILRARDTGASDVIGIGGDDPRDVAFDVGEAVEPAELLEDDDAAEDDAEDEPA